LKTATGALGRQIMQPEGDTGVIGPILRSHPQVSGYRLIARRGRGGVAEVWEAESPGGFRVALKLVHLSTDLRSGELRALKITRGIQHSGLLVVHGAWQVENLLVISMELADRSLWDRFLEANVQGLRGIPRGELLGYLTPVADAIDFLNGYRHTIDGRPGMGIQHRDLKPQNILLIRDRAKVADFGMARVMEGGVTSHTGPCTVPYAAPEYFGGRTSRQSDQYALAVTYCQLRGGRIPFPGTTAQMAVGHMCNAPDLEGLPEPERPVVVQALAKRPEERWPDCRAFIDSLISLGSASGCSIPDALQRDRRYFFSGRNGAGESSALGLDAADHDFIPVDSGELEPTRDSINSAKPLVAFWSWLAGLGSASRVRAWALDRRARYGHLLQNWLVERRYSKTTAGRPVAPEAAARSNWAAWLGEIIPLMETWLNLTRQIGRRAAREVAVRSGEVRIGSIAALVILGLSLWSLAVWSWAARQHPIAPSSDMIVGETTSSHVRTAPASDSSETGISKEPIARTLVDTLEPKPPPIPPAPGLPGTPHETAIVAAEPETQVVTGALSVSRTKPKNAVDASQPGEIVPPIPSLAAEEKESTRETPVVAARRPKVPLGRNPAILGLKSAYAWLQQSGLIRLVLSPSFPTSDQAKVKSGSVGTATVVSSHSNAGHLPRNSSVAPGGATPIIALPAEVILTAGTETKVHIRVRRRDTAKPVQLDFQGLPQGVSATGLTIQAGMESADVVLSAVAEPPPVSAKVRVAFTVGSERAEAPTRLKVLPPTPATVAYRRGVAALYRGSCDRAIAEFTEVIRLDPNSFGPRFHRGIGYSFAGRYQEALADFTAAIQLEPDHIEAYLERARVYINLGEKRLALNDYTKAIRLRPDAETYLARGRLHHEMGSYEQAMADCDRALHLRPGDSKALYRRGLIRYHSGDNARAVADFTEVIRLDPRDASAYRCRGDAYARLAKSAEAGADHESFERLSRRSGKGGSNKSEVPTGGGARRQSR
jgi:serine/threonine protein kinase/Flp pilus assembly protein TadD